METRNRRLEALEATILTQRGQRTSENKGEISVFTSLSPHAFFYGTMKWSFMDILKACADEYPDGISSLEQIDDDPLLLFDDVRWYDPIFSQWSFGSDYEGSITVKYSRSAQTYVIELFNSSSPKTKRERGDKFVAAGLSTKKEVLKLLNGAILWQELRSEQDKWEEKRRKKAILAELP